MITEDYVSFETAKLLKENGFDEPCYCAYKIITKPSVTHYQDKVTNSDLNSVYTNIEFGTLPTLQMAMKWLRVVHHIDIIVLTHYMDYLRPNEVHYYSGKILKGSEAVIETIYAKDTHEEVCEEAIKYCLENLI